MSKLELKHLAPYLPYGLKIYHKKEVFELTGIKPHCGITMLTFDGVGIEWGYINNCKPILRPLSDEFVKPIIDCIRRGDVDYNFIQRLIENHCDVLFLKEKGLAININDIEK